jgi:competence protein ComEC
MLFFALAAFLYAALFCARGLALLPAANLQPAEGLLSGEVSGFLGEKGVIIDEALFEGRAAGKVVLYAPGGAFLRPGQRVEMQGLLSPLRNDTNPGAFDFRRYAYGLGLSYSAKGEILSVSGQGRAPSALEKLKNALETRIALLWPEHEGLLKALLLGEGGEMDDELRRAYQRSGAAHVLAVSGLHVGFIALLIGLLLFFLPKNSKPRLLCALGFLLLYALLTGARPSVLRACVMAGAALALQGLGRRPDSLSTLSLTAGLMLFLAPRQLLSVSFQLSFGAVLGILLLNPRFEGWLGRLRFLPRFVRSALSVSLAAQLGCLPGLLQCYGSLPLLSLLSNLLLVPLSGALVCLGVVTLLLSFALPVSLPATLVSLCAAWMNALSEGIAALPYALLYLPKTPEALSALWPFILYLCSGEFGALSRRSKFALVGFCPAALIAIALAFAPPLFPRETELSFLSVGSADSILARKGRVSVLIDTGRDGEAALHALQAADPYLEALIITHADADHAGGLLNLCQNLRVREILYPKGLEADREFFAELRRAQALGAAARPVAAGDRLCYDGMEFEVLWPERMETAKQNDFSLVLRLTSGGKSALLTADINAFSQKGLLLPASDVLKVPHHGSADGLTQANLRAVSPQIAIVSVGPNPYGLPSLKTLRALESGGIPVYRTDEKGAVQVILSEGELKTRFFAP